jgi:hypothetical protein
MTRSELMALAERLSAARVYGRDIEQAADFLRQLAESKPVPGAIFDGKPLYTLPLED